MLERIEVITDEVETAKRWFKTMTQMLETRCKFCGSDRVVRNGKSKKGVQNWICRSCGKGFVDNRALPRMRNSVGNVASALYQYYTGSSLNDIRGHIEQQTGIRPSDSTIFAWVNRFSKVAVDEARNYHPQVGDTWIADETVLKIEGKNVWFWDIIDADTRFLLASHISSTRTTRDAQELMQKAYEKAGKAPKRIITDRLRAYLDGIELTFGANAKHVQSSPFVETDSTNLIERFHGSLKDRTKVMRGLKKIETAKLFTDGWLVYYNYFRPHESLKDKTPAEVAKIKFPFRNWADVVISQAPIPQAVQSDDRIIISTDFQGAEKLKKVRKRRVRKQHIMRKVIPTASEVKGIR